MIALIDEKSLRREHIAANVAYYLAQEVKVFDSPEDLLEENNNCFSVVLFETETYQPEEACRLIKTLCQQFPLAPVFIISSLFVSSPFIKAGAVGFAQYPCNFSRLAQDISRCLEMRGVV